MPDLPARRRTATLSELVVFRTGKLDSNAAAANGDYPFFTCSQETLRTNTFSFDEECVLLAGNNANGIFPLKYYRGKFDAYQRTYVITTRDPNQLVVRFLYYALRQKLSEFRNLSTGAATKFLTLMILNRTEIQVPSLGEQRRIASILGAYDDLIEVNRRRIALLEEEARGLFAEWFVHFRFPGHSGSAMVETSDGPIPKGWRNGMLGDVVEQRRDKTTPGEHLSERVYVPIECIGRKTLALSETRPWSEAQSSLQLFERDDILFGAMRAYFHKVVPAPLPGITRSTCFVLRPRSSSYFSFATLALFREETVAFAAANSKGSTIPYASWAGSLERFPVALPSVPLLAKFDEIVRPIIEAIMSMCESNTLLAASRDLLLPLLVSGDVSVSTAERELEAVA
jgi:type I restriction enzyme S subunit